MKSAIPIAAGLALALAPAAHAQVTCAEMSRVTAYAKKDFEDITGARIEDDFFKATFSLSGAIECTLDLGWDALYQCTWVYDSLAAASAAYQAQRGAVAACVPGWSPDPLTPDESATDGYRKLEGVFYLGAGSNVDLEWGVFVEEHTQPDKTDWHVIIGLAYLW